MWTDGLPHNLCNLCRKRSDSGQFYRCKRCDFDCCTACFTANGGEEVEVTKDDTIFMPHVVYECKTCMMDETEG